MKQARCTATKHAARAGQVVAGLAWFDGTLATYDGPDDPLLCCALCGHLDHVEHVAASAAQRTKLETAAAKFQAQMVAAGMAVPEAIAFADVHVQMAIRLAAEKNK